MSEISKEEANGLYIAALRRWGHDLQFTVLWY